MIRTGNGDEPAKTGLIDFGTPAADEAQDVPPDLVGEEEPAEEAPAEEAPEDEYVPPAEEEPQPEQAKPVKQAKDEEVAGKKKKKASASDMDVLNISLDKLETSPGRGMDAAEKIFIALEKVDRDTKEDALGRLVALHEKDGVTKDQVKAIEYVFDRIRTKGYTETFELAMRAAVDMERNDHKVLQSFLMNFTKKISEDHADAKDKGCREAYLEGMAAYASAHPDKIAPAIDRLFERWFEDPGKGILWHALMAISEANGDVTLKAGTVEGKAVKAEVQMGGSLHDHVKRLFYDHLKEITYDGGKSGIAIMIIHHIPPRAAALHIEILDELSANAPLKGKTAMLSALHDIEPRVGEARKDPRAVRKVYGNIIAELKDVCKGDEICRLETSYNLGENATINTSFPTTTENERWRRRWFSPIVHVSGFQATQGFMGVSGEPTEQLAVSGGANVDLLFSELEHGVRLMTGLYFNGRKDHNWAAGVRFGPAMDMGPYFNLKVPLSVGWTHTSAFDDERDDVPIELDGDGVNDDGTAWTFVPNRFRTDMHAAAVTIDPEINFMFARWPMNDHGGTFALGVFLGLTAGAFFGTMSDSDCSHAYTPGDVEVSPSGAGYEVSQDAELGERCRDDAFTSGFIFGGRAGLTLEFGI